MSGKETIEIERSRYDELIAKEERLKMLEYAVNNLDGYILAQAKDGLLRKKD